MIDIAKNIAMVRDRIEMLGRSAGLKLGGIVYGPLPNNLDNLEGNIFITSCHEFAYGVIEKGARRTITRTLVLDDLLYAVFWDLTFGAAVEYELKHRKQHQDTRRQIFEHQLELFGRLNADWQQRARSDIAKILSKAPYTDMQ